MTTPALAHSFAPDVGVIVEYGLDGFEKEPARYRVDGWMRAAPAPVFASHDFIGRILFDSAQKIADPADGKSKRMQFCLREEATHLALAGVCGAIAPIGQCKVVGRVDWSQAHLDGVRQQAVQFGRAREMLF